MEIEYVRSDLRKKHPLIFGFINLNPSPILIEVPQKEVSSLLSENGLDSMSTIQTIEEFKKEFPDFDNDLLLQQCNFRLNETISINNLKIWLIHINKSHPDFPEYEMYEIDLKSRKINY